METKTITMPLSEYEHIISENERMNKILNKKKENIIPVYFSSDNMGMGWVRNSWYILTKDIMITKLSSHIEVLKKQIADMNKNYWELEAKLPKKKTYWWNI